MMSFSRLVNLMRDFALSVCSSLLASQHATGYERLTIPPSMYTSSSVKVGHILASFAISPLDSAYFPTTTSPCITPPRNCSGIIRRVLRLPCKPYRYDKARNCGVTSIFLPSTVGHSGRGLGRGTSKTKLSWGSISVKVSMGRASLLHIFRRHRTIDPEKLFRLGRASPAIWT